MTPDTATLIRDGLALDADQRAVVANALFESLHDAGDANDVDAAVRWYEEQEPGIGLMLIDWAQQARKDLAHWPNAAPPFTTTVDGTVIRSKAVHGYPYRIVDTVEPDTGLILAFAHERREPGYWLRRLNDWAARQNRRSMGRHPEPPIH